MSAGLGPSEPQAGGGLLPVPRRGRPLCARLCPSLVLWDQPTLTTSSLHNHLIKGLVVKCSRPPRGWGVRASTYEV